MSSLTLTQQYENETGKSAWKIPNYTFTDEYVAWIKSYVNKSDSLAAKAVKSFANKLTPTNKTSQ